MYLSRNCRATLGADCTLAIGQSHAKLGGAMYKRDLSRLIVFYGIILAVASILLAILKG